jgi:hypothetical protein
MIQKAEILKQRYARCLQWTVREMAFSAPRIVPGETITGDGYLSSPLSSELFLAPLRAGQFFVCLSSGSRKKAVVVLKAVELVGNPQGCPSGGGQVR